MGGFSAAAANPALLAFAAAERARRPGLRVLDLGCGAARNAVPMAARGATVIGLDLVWPMLHAARGRASEAGVAERIALVRAPMDRLPIRDASVDLVVAHGIWNLARTDDELRHALAEGARVARPGAGLFVVTFSRATLPPDARRMAGQRYVYTQFSGDPQCFLTAEELAVELGRAGFDPDPAVALAELNAPRPGRTIVSGGPVLFQGAFRRRASA